MIKREKKARKQKQRGIRAKIQIIYSLFAAVCITASVFVAQSYITKTFDKLEYNAAQGKLLTLSKTYNDIVYRYTLLVHDYSIWDDTYSYIQNGDSDFIPSSLPDHAFANLQINLILITNQSGEIVFSKMLDYTDVT
jgi:sensor domain CHASE-containing protein